MAVCIRILGPLTVEVDGRPRPVGGATQRTVLALLAAAVNEPLSVGRLVEATWGSSPPADPDHALQSQVSRIRRALHGQDDVAVVRGTGSYRLEAPPGIVDAGAFEERATTAIEAWRQEDGARATEAADAALALWRGAPLHDVRDAPLLRTTATGLIELNARLRELRADVALATHRADDVVADLTRLVDEHPLRESAWERLARAHAAAGRPHQALSLLRELRQVLRDELGVDPSARIGHLYTQLLQDGATAAQPPTTAAGGSSPSLPAPLAAVRHGPWVGRESVMRQLVMAWRQSDRTTVAVVSGEAGIGKTRLAAEVAHEVAAAGGRVLHGGCTPDIRAPYEPFVEALGGAPWEDAASGQGGLFADAAARRRRIADTVGSRLLERADGGTLLVLDDLHWADTATLEVLAMLVRRPPPGRLLVLGTYRDTDVRGRHPLVGVLADLSRHGPGLHVPLEGLDEAAVGHLLDASSAAGTAVQSTTAAQLRAACGGNPFYVMAVRDELARSAPAERTGTLPLPARVRDVVADRLARLEPDVAATLATAAVLEPEVEVELLAAATARSADAVIDALDAATNAGILDEVGLGRYRFAHDIVRIAVLQAQSRTRVARHHRAVAEALGRRGDAAAQLAHHLGHAGDDEATRRRAAAAAVEAGQDALRDAAPADAADHFQSAIDRLGGVDATRLLRQARLGMGIARRDTGDPTHREELLDLAREAHADGDATTLVAAALANHRGMWSSLNAPDDDRIEVLEAAAEGAGTEADTARLLARLAVEAVFDPSRDHVELLGRARALADPGDTDVLAEVRFAEVTAGWVPERAAMLHEVSAELVELQRARGDRAALAQALMWHGVHLRTAGRTADARVALTEATQLAELLDHDTLRVFAAGYGCAQAMLEGDLAAAESAAEAARSHGERTGQPDIGDWYVAMVVLVRMAAARLPELFPMILARAERGGDNLTQLGVYQGCLVLALADAGRCDEARTLWCQLADGAPRAPRDFVWLQTIASLALAPGPCIDPSRAAALHDLVAPLAPQFVNGGIGMWGALDHTVALLAAAAGEPEAATAAFDRAEAEQARAGAAVWQVHTAIARAHHDAAGGANLDAPAMRLAWATSEAERLGCPALAERARRGR